MGVKNERRGIEWRGIVLEGHLSVVGVVEKKSVSGAWRAVSFISVPSLLLIVTWTTAKALLFGSEFFLFHWPRLFGWHIVWLVRYLLVPMQTLVPLFLRLDPAYRNLLLPICRDL